MDRASKTLRLNGGPYYDPAIEKIFTQRCVIIFDFNLVPKYSKLVVLELILGYQAWADCHTANVSRLGLVRARQEFPARDR